MDKAMILSIFRQHYGSGVWASRLLKIKRSTLSKWLHGVGQSSRLDAEVPKLADMLVRTNGNCMRANGPSVRSKVGRIRGAAKRGHK